MMEDNQTLIQKFLQGLMTEAEEREFFKKLTSDPKFQEDAAIEALLYKHCNIDPASKKRNSGSG